MSTFICYAPDTGQIVSMQMPGDADGLRQVLAERGDTFIEIDPSIDRSYVDPETKQLKLRPRFPNDPDKPEVGVFEEVSWGEVQTGATVEVLGPFRDLHVHEGGELKLSFGFPGTYEVRIEAFPAQKTGYEIKVS